MVCLGAHGNDSVATANYLTDLESHYDAKQQVSVFKEVCVLLKNFNGNVKIDSDIL
jgi:hypothetical protein